MLCPSHQRANWGGTLLPGAALPSGSSQASVSSMIRSQAEFNPQGQED